ncbi:MAG: hypothetical protein ISR87_08150 [Candidatus Marinimicrobia bacterium]|nr:hypothetical protein [FCB group bacterium]MBL7025415.1 hypothetical protein [Candidatus Neomarinimicrobiota bacterium]
MRKCNWNVLIVLVFILYVNNDTCFSQTSKDTLYVLFVGNSFTYSNDLPQMVSMISDSAHINLVAKMSVGPGVKISDHWRGTGGLKTKEIIKKEKFDIVILQGQSMAPMSHPDSFIVYRKLFCDYVKENGAEPFIFSSWAPQKLYNYQEELTSAYSTLSREINTDVLPIGPAWNLAHKLKPRIELFNSDGRHPSVLGTFLTACVITKTLTGELPENLPTYFTMNKFKGESGELVYLSISDINFCREIANQIVSNKN